VHFNKEAKPTQIRVGTARKLQDLRRKLVAKEARFGKSPDTVIFNANGNYSVEELNNLSVEQLEQLMKKEYQKTLENKTLSEHP